MNNDLIKKNILILKNDAAGDLTKSLHAINNIIKNNKDQKIIIYLSERSEKFSFLNVAKDVLITSLLRTALIFNKNIKAANFNIDTINQKTYVFGIAHNNNERKEIIQEAKQIVDLKELVTSILMVSDLSRQRE